MWITFLIPKIEDGNNFGVSIQEDTLGEVRTVEAEAAAFYEQISRYYMGRGKIISKVSCCHCHPIQQFQLYFTHIVIPLPFVPGCQVSACG